MQPGRKGAVIAIDHGTKSTGFAVTDALRASLQPLAPFRGGRAELLDHIEELAGERDVEAFVVGLPLNMRGDEGPRAKDVRGFLAELAARFPLVRVVALDERLTTKAGEELLREQGVRGARARELRDSASAVVLLRDWLASGEPS